MSAFSNCEGINIMHTMKIVEDTPEDYLDLI